jgi:hypothetical protein
LSLEVLLHWVLLALAVAAQVVTVSAGLRAPPEAVVEVEATAPLFIVSFLPG